jgi:CheY-like chemotaxis protein
MEVPNENNSGGEKIRKYTLKTKNHLIAQTSSLTTRKSSAAKINGMYIARALDDEQKYRAIVVDDNDVNLMVLGNLLKLFGVYSLFAKNGKECINLVQELITKDQIYPIKIIFMDMQMPVMGGIECTPILNGLIGNCSVFPIPIIGVSSDNSEEDRRKFILSGIQEFASKPVSKSWVMRVLQRYSII